MYITIHQNAGHVEEKCDELMGLVHDVVIPATLEFGDEFLFVDIVIPVIDKGRAEEIIDEIQNDEDPVEGEYYEEDECE